MNGLHFDSLKKKQQGKPDAGKPHVRFDEGEASRPWRAGTSLLYSKQAVNESLLSCFAVRRAS